MGVSFSYPFADFDDLDEDFDEDFEALIMSSTNFNDDDDEKKTWRSASFNGRDFEPTIFKSFRSLSFNRRELDSFHSKATVSLDSPLSKEGTLRSASCCGKEASDFSPASNGTFERPSGSPVSSEPQHQAAVKLQKVYKSFQTRRRLADCAVLVEQHWWKLLDFALLKQSSISFFDIEKPQTALSRWSRARTRAAMVGRGLSKDKKARKLALQHWLEAIDPRHRYGHNLHVYYVSWLQCESKQPFFYWLDVGEGRDVNIEECPRSTLQHQCIKYLGPKEREAYEVVVESGMFHYKHNGELLDTYEEPKDTKWIFVLSTSKKLYVGQKKKGVFQHSSFLAGGATSAAGRLVVEKGILKAVWPHSGHYRPTKENFQEFITFLKKKNVDLTNVKESPEEEEEELESWNNNGSYMDLRGDLSLQGNLLSRPIVAHDISTGTSGSSTGQERSTSNEEGLTTTATTTTTTSDLRMESGLDETTEASSSSSISDRSFMFKKRNLFEEQDVEEEESVPPESILKRINSRKGMKSYQLGQQLTFKWTTGAGPRIVCVRDYPSELQFRALEEVNLSPRSGCNSSRFYSSPRSIKCQSPKPAAISCMPKSKAGNTIFSKSEADNNIQSR